MIWLRVLGGAVLCLAVGFLTLDARGGKKEAAADDDFINGKIQSVDARASVFTLKLKNGKDRKFKVTDGTKFFGPQGGISKKGIKDDRMVKGNTVKVLPSKDGKSAQAVHLPLRKSKKS
ncbi:MAG: hypothetical protein FJ271_10135 [Planctomycetes bacterium]|nr:hypothetical protein [Planctomycetota bacterium]